MRCPRAGAGGTLGPAPKHAGVWVLGKGAQLSRPHNLSEQQRWETHPGADAKWTPLVRDQQGTGLHVPLGQELLELCPGRRYSRSGLLAWLINPRAAIKTKYCESDTC